MHTIGTAASVLSFLIQMCMVVTAEYQDIALERIGFAAKRLLGNIPFGLVSQSACPTYCRPYRASCNFKPD